MRAFFAFVLVLTVLCAPPARAGIEVPSGTDLIVTVSCGEGGFKKLLGAWAMFPQATEGVAEEHVQGFAKEWGVDLSVPFSFTFTAPKAKVDEAVISGTMKVDRGTFAKAVKLKDPAAEISETPDVLTVKEKAVEAEFRADGTFRIHRRGRAASKPDDALAKEFAGRAGDDPTFAVWVNLPAGIPGAPPPAIRGQPIAGLWPRVRGAFFAFREKDFALELTFNDADAAKAGQPMIAGYLKTIEGALGTAAATAEKAARAQTPVNWMDPAWLGARLSHATAKHMIGLLQVAADGAKLTLALPRDALPAGNPAMTMGIVGVLAAVAVPNFQAARGRANDRACYANCRTIAGALEMYKLDKGKPVDALNAGVFEELKTGGYLMSVPQDPGQGPNTAGNYYLTPKGVACKVHGDQSK